MNVPLGRILLESIKDLETVALLLLLLGQILWYRLVKGDFKLRSL